MISVDVSSLDHGHVGFSVGPGELVGPSETLTWTTSRSAGSCDGFPGPAHVFGYSSLKDASESLSAGRPSARHAGTFAKDAVAARPITDAIAARCHFITFRMCRRAAVNTLDCEHRSCPDPEPPPPQPSRPPPPLRPNRFVEAECHKRGALRR